MSRLYDNTSLKNLPQGNITWPSNWNTDSWSKDGSGVLLEACIKGKSRITVSDSTKNKMKYLILHVDPGRAHRRKFDGNGKEIEPNFSDTTKVLTGYLNSSYKTEARGESDKITQQELISLLIKPRLKDLTVKSAPLNTLSLWIEESQLDNMELDTDDLVRIKTRGNSPFIYSIGKVEGLSSKVSNFAGGDEVGASWTDKIMAMQQPVTATSPGDNEIGDEEWDD